MPDALSSPLANLRRLPTSAPGWEDRRALAFDAPASGPGVRWTAEEEARLRREWPTCRDVLALAVSMGRPAAQLRSKAWRLRIRRDPAIVLQEQSAAGRRGRRKPDRDARIIAEFPTHPNVPALAAELGMPRTSLYLRAKALGVRRDPAITEQARREQAKASYRKQLARRNDTMRLDRSKLDPLPVERSPAEDARRARGWQLAEVLLIGPASWRSLRRSGWTEPAMRHLLAESPDWFRGVEWDGELVQVELTEAGRVEFGGTGQPTNGAHHKGIKL